MRHLKIGLSCLALLSAGCTTHIEPAYTAPDIGLISFPSENVESPAPVPESPSWSDAEPVFTQVTIIDETAQGGVVEQPVVAAPIDQAKSLFDEAAAAELAGDFALMMEKLNAAAEQGSAPAHYALAKHYTAGTAGPRDLLKAEVHLGVAESLGHAEAIRVVGWKLLRGDDRPKNITEGVAKLTLAAETSPRAMRELGLLNLGIAEPNLHSPSTGRALLERAHAAGDADAAFFLSRQMEKEGDKESAAVALQDAVARRSARALTYAAEQKMKANEVEQAGQLLRDAALLGDAQAMFVYASMIQTGKLSSADRSFDTVLWLSLAAEREHKLAKKELSLQEGAIKQAEITAPGKLAQEKSSLNEEIRRAKLQVGNG